MAKKKKRYRVVRDTTWQYRRWKAGDVIEHHCNPSPGRFEEVKGTEDKKENGKIERNGGGSS